MVLSLRSFAFTAGSKAYKVRYMKKWRDEWMKRCEGITRFALLGGSQVGYFPTELRKQSRNLLVIIHDKSLTRKEKQSMCWILRILGNRSFLPPTHTRTHTHHSRRHCYINWTMKEDLVDTRKNQSRSLILCANPILLNVIWPCFL